MSRCLLLTAVTVLLFVASAAILTDAASHSTLLARANQADAKLTAVGLELAFPSVVNMDGQWGTDVRKEEIGTILRDGRERTYVANNQIGFAFASLSVGLDDGSDSPIGNSRAKLAEVAKMLHLADQNGLPGIRVVLEGHVGVSAPSDIAQDWSEQRAHIVAHLLETEHGICSRRVLTRGWGSRVAEAAQSSTHPNAHAAQAGYGWVDIFFVAPDETYHPPRPSYYPTVEVAAPPPPAPRAKPSSHPIFYMCPGVNVGDEVTLRLFEPRYKILIQRAWASDKTFVFCARPPMWTASHTAFNLRTDEEPEDDGCVSVVVEHATFGPDGGAEILGRAVAPVTLLDVQLEPHTGGLFSTRTLASAAGASDAADVADTLGGQSLSEASASASAAHAKDLARHGQPCPLFALVAWGLMFLLAIMAYQGWCNALARGRRRAPKVSWPHTSPIVLPAVLPSVRAKAKSIVIPQPAALPGSIVSV